jgi:hypothetical protein
VISLGYGRALELCAADFRQFLSKYPHVRTQIGRAAEVRTRSGGRQLNVS